MPSLIRLAVALASGLLALAAGVPSAAAGPPRGHRFSGVPYVGALFHQGGGPGSHFCTAAVVSSPRGNLAITSAHCMASRKPSAVVFAPGYNGNFPHGTVAVTGVYTSHAWSAHHNINDDVAILRLGSDIQPQTGALRLATGRSPRPSKVIGYPDGRRDPVRCTARATWHTRRHQMKFVCGGFPDGTSGGPWIIGKTQVYGVIGGYQQGGVKPYISYSPYFGGTIRALYRRAVSRDS